MAARLVVELTPQEVAEVIGDFVAQKYGAGGADIQFLDATGVKISFGRVVVSSQWPHEHMASHPVKSRMAQLRAQQDAHLRAFDNEVESLREQQESG